ncbi:uncharacterized protein LOC135686180 [Rhopilema esculentum]|uniref:uncharacterized protein LOC135686180 n=1 Tax=Rhopilema esculentum TaxID=499914 RepID=UPI0031E322EE
MVTGMPMKDENYDIAVNLLKKRFGKQELIQQAHISHLLGLHPVYNDKAVSRLRNLHDEIETHYRGLEALGVNTSSFSAVVVPTLLEKVPENIKGQMIRSSDKNYLKWTINELLCAFEKEISIKECQMPLESLGGRKDLTSRANNNNIRPRSNFIKEGTASSLLVGEKANSCVFCMRDHASETCTNVLGAENRKNVLRKYARCFVCLKSGHRAFSCRHKNNCRICNGLHHVSICHNVSSIDRPKQSSVQVNAEKPNAPLLNPTAASWVESTGSRGDVALQTASENVNGESARLLYDSGSHKSFVTAEAVNRLGLRVRREEKLGIKPFGSVSAEIEVKDVVNVPMVSFDGKRKIEIECFVVSNISHIKNVHPEVVKKSYTHLHNI